MSGTVKRFGLSFVNAAEDIPRLIRAYGKCCEGECALVLRPHETKGILVHHDKKGEATLWSETSNDAPGKPMEIVPLKDSVARVKEYQKGLLKAGPITLRGNWSGFLICEEGVPRVELSRKLASYGTLVITSVPGKGWKYRVVRAEKWFSKPGDEGGMGQSLTVAIEKGLASAMGLLGEACSVRDSRRRAAFDATFAEAHPIKPAREGKDPTEKFNPKEPKSPKSEKASKPATSRGMKGTPAESKPAQGASTAAEPALPGPAPAAQKASRRKASPPANSAMPVPAPQAAPDAGDIDPAKDKLLMDAFGAAIAQAMGKMN